jgi:antitoxin component YwqK of YwqJK toxin-antitoxin module
MYSPTAFPKSNPSQTLFAYAVCVFLALALLGSCSTEEERTAGKVDENQSEKKESQDQKNLRFVSNDRKKEQILADYEKPIVSYPAITSTESKLGEDGLVYRDGIETPFTGRIIDRFESGVIQMDSSYLEGQPHGLQVRYYKNGKPALEATFDNGRLSGIKSRWWESGLIREEEYWSDGNYRGRRLWDESGRLTKEEMLP